MSTEVTCNEWRPSAEKDGTRIRFFYEGGFGGSGIEPDERGVGIP